MSATLSGRPAAPGAAVAPAFIVTARPVTSVSALPERRTLEAAPEKERLGAALKRAEAELRALAMRVADHVGEDEAEIFEAHAEFAADPELQTMADRSIDEGVSAERSVAEAFGTFREMLLASASEYLAARAEDLDDVRDRVIAILQGVDTAVDIPTRPSVIAAHALTPSQTASIPRELIAAIVTATGSPTSHAAILARALGVPAIVAVSDLMPALSSGVLMGVDGRSGQVVIDPMADEAARFEALIEQETRHRESLSGLRDELGRTADGHRVELAANIGSREDLEPAREAGAEGSGLVRTEFLFLGRNTAPSVEEQVDFYTEVLRAFPGQRVVFRTMDVGADKPLPFVEREPEENPALGLRGIRLSLSRPKLFSDQLRALLRAGAAAKADGGGRMAIMFPLVSVVDELIEARGILDRIADEEGIPTKGLEVGVMIEVPSAALSAARVARHADFLSIGTNDLLQYLFAADRLVGEVAELTDICHPDVLALVGSIIASGHEHESWVGVCGEAGSDPAVAVALTGLGVDELSMTRAAIPEVKDTLRSVTLDKARTAATHAIAAPSAAVARQILEEAIGKA